MSPPEQPAASFEIPERWECCEITGLPQEAKLFYWKAFRAIGLRANKNNPASSLILRPNALATYASKSPQFTALLTEIQTRYPGTEITFY